MAKIKVHIWFSNPKNYAPLMLFFGCVFEILGTVTERLAVLSQDGWYLIVGSAILWLAELMCRVKRH